MQIRVLTLVTLGCVFLSSLLSSPCHGDDAVKYGANIRLYQEFRKNTFDRNSRTLRNEDFLRLSTSLWGSWNVTKNIAGLIRVSNESKYFLESPSADNQHFKWDDIFIESLYVDWREMGGAPVDVKVGRQNVTYGDGFVVYDGTSTDRDRSIYSNAVKTSWRINPDHTLDLVYINNPMTDEFLPTIYSANNTGTQYVDHKRKLNASDEQGVVVYSTNALTKNLAFEPYYVFKREDRISATVPELDLHTFGSRSVYDMDGWKATAEFAYQTGEYDGGRSRSGYGGRLFVRRTFKDVFWKPQIEMGHVYLSGDDPNSSSHEGWNPVFSRWVWLLKFYTQHYLPETGYSSYWTNLQLYRGTTRLHFTPDTNLFLTYNYLRANEETRVTGANAAFLSNSGKERGHLVQARMNHRFNKYLDAYIAAEYFIPGDFYKLTASEALFHWQIQLNL